MDKTLCRQSEPRCLSTDVVAAGRFLRLENIRFSDRQGRQRNWEAAQRQQEQQAVLIIATLRPSGDILFIRQFRPPVNAFVIEFPAGLIDAGESPAEAAIRELHEETGYHGRVLWDTGPGSSSAGMTGELVTTVFMDVDEKDPANAKHQQQLDDGEDITVIPRSAAAIPAFLRERQQAGDILDSRLAAWVAGCGWQWR
ncbi:MAG: NUDIX domain-containing protein [Lentisphaeria bacterium]|jgi:ADP-ribose pyrophosphatase